MNDTDARIPVLLGRSADAGPADLVMALPSRARHVGCACCGGRDPLAVALAAAFVARVRGTAPWFDRVVLLAGADAAARCRAVLEGDPVAAARFRFAGHACGSG